MTPKEAKENIGKEVVLDESTLPYTDLDGKYDIETCHEMQQVNYYNLVLLRDKDALISTKIGSNTLGYSINIKHLKLKEQPMNYKIKVTPETSEEVQELLFVLGYQWRNIRRTLISIGNEYLYTDEFRLMSLDSNNADDCKEITLPQLRDMVVLKRNNVSDATHAYKNDNKEKYYIGHSVYRWNDSCWKEIALNETYISCWLELIGADTQMTLQDALLAISEGKEVLFNDKILPKNMNSYLKKHFYGCSFSLKPKTTHIDSGDYTKEELLKIAGEME